MTDRLRAEYEKYLGRYQLKPRRVPPPQEREASLREVVRVMYEEAVSRGDPMAASILTAYEENRERYLAETRHTAAIAIEDVAAEIEATICAIPAFANSLRADVFVGEFPTGSVNCETVRVDGGYLVLVNSGTLSMLQQVVGFLCRGDPDHPDSQKNLDVADGIAAVLASYIEDGDPFYGPRPLNGGMPAVLAGLLSRAANKFAIAHEYGHILAGHLDHAETIAIDTKIGPIEVLGKRHAEEFEADEIGYRLALGVSAYDDFDLKVIDTAAASTDLEAIHAAVKQKSLIAAPFVPLTMDLILARFAEGAGVLSGKPAAPQTHPPASDRIEKLLALTPGADPRYSGYINIPFLLLPAVDRIAGMLLKRAFPQPGAPGDDEKAAAEAVEHPQEADNLMQCVGAIHHGDYADAALLLTDVFEQHRTIYEPDVDVVCREIVRAALGRSSDISRILLDRHNARRAVEQRLRSARRGGIGLGPIALSGLAPNEPPVALSMVKAALDKARSREPSCAGLELLRALVAAWRGDREECLSALGSALRAGASDPDGRLARFLALEKLALDLKLRLDIQELLEAVALRALGADGAAHGPAALVKSYVEYLGIPLGPAAQRLIETQLERGA